MKVEDQRCEQVHENNILSALGAGPWTVRVPGTPGRGDRARKKQLSAVKCLVPGVILKDDFNFHVWLKL